MITERQRAIWTLKHLVRDLLQPPDAYAEVAPELAGLVAALTESELNAVIRIINQIRTHPWPPEVEA